MLRWSSSKQTLKQFPAQFYCQATWQCKLQPERRQHAPHTPPTTHTPPTLRHALHTCLAPCVCTFRKASGRGWAQGAGFRLQAASIDNAEMLLICATLFCTEAKLLNRLCIMQVLPTFYHPIPPPWLGEHSCAPFECWQSHNAHSMREKCNANFSSKSFLMLIQAPNKSYKFSLTV